MAQGGNPLTRRAASCSWADGRDNYTWGYDNGWLPRHLPALYGVAAAGAALGIAVVPRLEAQARLNAVLLPAVVGAAVAAAAARARAEAAAAATAAAAAVAAAAAAAAAAARAAAVAEAADPDEECEASPDLDNGHVTDRSGDDGKPTLDHRCQNQDIQPVSVGSTTDQDKEKKRVEKNTKKPRKNDWEKALQCLRLGTVIDALVVAIGAGTTREGLKKQRRGAPPLWVPWEPLQPTDVAFGKLLEEVQESAGVLWVKVTLYDIRSQVWYAVHRKKDGQLCDNTIWSKVNAAEGGLRGKLYKSCGFALRLDEGGEKAIAGIRQGKPEVLRSSCRSAADQCFALRLSFAKSTQAAYWLAAHQDTDYTAQGGKKFARVQARAWSSPGVPW